MSKKHLSRNPHYIRAEDCDGPIHPGDVWWYETSKGINIVFPDRRQFYIRWKAIKAALKRKERPDVAKGVEK